MKSSLLEPSEHPTFSFPLLPRRPLRSQTYSTFVEILSHCALLQSPQLPPSQAGETSVPNVSPPHLKELVPHDSVVLHELPAGFADEDIHKMPNEVHCLDPMDVEVEANGEERDVNDVSPVDASEENNAHIRSVCHLDDEKKSSCTEVGHEGIIEQKLDKLPILHDYEVPSDFCLHTGTVFEVSAPPQQGDDTSFKDEMDMSEELRMKEKELGELICTPALDSSNCLASALGLSVCLAADDIEEGEVSGDEASYEIMDFLFDSAEAQEGHGSENQSGAIGHGEMDMTAFFSLEKVHNSDDMLDTQSIITHLDANKEPFSYEERVEIIEPSKSDSAIEIGQILENAVDVKSNLTAVAENLAQHRNIISNHTTEDRDVLADEKDVCAAKNEKKKRGPVTKERKAKKKKKERIKRAENNRKLGVKRLKLQPVVKQPKLTYCRHYMKGRCQEGEKCKYSHDTTPLTKSMPCCHFARNSCMKGDGCPYDHQLSKYPCNNYVTNGFCYRGDDCMFSHEISVTGCSKMTSNICKPDLKSPVQNSDLNSKKQTNFNGNTNQKFDSNSKSMEKSTSRGSEKILVPKGISIISFGGGSSSHVEEKVVNVDQQAATIDSLNRVEEKSNEVANKVVLKPKGVNFLSFGKTPNNASQFDGRHDVGETNRSSIFDLPSSSNKTPDMMPKGSSYYSNPFSLCSVGTPFSIKESLLSNVPKSALKALNSTLAFAAKFDSQIKMNVQDATYFAK